MLINYYSMTWKLFAHRENTNKIRVEVAKGGQPLWHIPINPTQLLSPQTSLMVYYHLLGADPNVVLSLKTEATAPHYLSMRLYLSRPFKAPFLPRVSPKRYFTSRSLANTLYPQSFLSRLPISLSLSPSPVARNSHSTPAGHNTRYPWRRVLFNN